MHIFFEKKNFLVYASQIHKISCKQKEISKYNKNINIPLKGRTFFPSSAIERLLNLGDVAETQRGAYLREEQCFK